MATELGVAYVNIVASTKGLGAGIAREFSVVERDAAKAGDNAGRKMAGGLSSSLKKGLAAGGVAAVGALALAQPFGEWITSAAKLEQSWGSMDAVFGEHAGKLKDYAEQAPKRLGLTTNAYNDLVKVVGNQLKPAITNTSDLASATDELTLRAADLAAGMGGTTTEVMEGFSAALRGEYDTIERFVPGLTAATVETKAMAMGLATSTEELTTQDKTLATHALLLENSANWQGQFNKEQDTAAHQMEVASAEWGNLKDAIATNFLPVVTDVMRFIADDMIPGMYSLGENLKPVAENAGKVWDKLAPVGEWIAEHRDDWGPFAAGLGLVAGGFVAWSVGATLAAAATTGLGLAAGFLMRPVTLVVGGLGLLTGAIIWAYENVDGFRNLVDKSWAWIKNVTSRLVGWWTGTAFPALQRAIGWVGDKIMWFWNDIIKPAWTGIRIAISIVVGTIITIFKGLVWVLDKTLGTAFRWLWNGVVKPVFNWIGDKIAAFSRWFSGNLVPAIRRSLQWVGDKFSWLWTNIVRPVWSWISDKVTGVWNWIRTRAFDPMMNWLNNKIPGGFAAVKDAIGRQWGKLKGIVSAPVRFFVETVYNNGLRANINSVMSKVGLDRKHNLPAMSLAGFARGGIVPGYSSVKRDDQLIPMRSGEGVLVPEAVRAMGAGVVNSINAAANRGGVAGAKKAWGMMHGAGAGMPGDPAYFSGGHWAAVKSARRMNVSGDISSNLRWGLGSAIRTWDGAAGVAVKRGSKYPNAHASTSTVPPGAPPYWYGYSTGPNISLNSAIRGGISGQLAKAVTIHEIGHSLGLPHVSHRPSVMHPFLRSSMTPTTGDIRALQGLYPGGSGKAGSGSGILDFLNPVKSLISGIKDKILSGFGSGMMSDLVSHVARSLGDKLIDWVMKLGGDSEGDGGFARPKLYDDGGLLHRGVQVIDHQRSAPDRVLTDRQWSAMYSTAEAVSSGLAGNGVTVVVPEREGIDPAQFGQRVGEGLSWELQKAGI